MAQSTYETVLDACRAAIVNAGLEGVAITSIKVRALPKASEGLDVLPCIIIAPAGEERVAHQSFSGEIDVEYPVEVAIIAANNREMAQHFRTVLGWREKIRRALYEPSLTDAPTVWKVEPKFNSPLERSQLNQQYAYSSLLFLFTSHELRN